MAQLPAGTASFAHSTISGGSGGPFTVIGRACTNVPPVPAIVNVNCDVDVPGASATVIVVVPGAMTVDGLKLTVTPAGAPVAVNATGPLNVPCARIATETAPLLPAAICGFGGVAAMLKSGGSKPYTWTRSSCDGM